MTETSHMPQRDGQTPGAELFVLLRGFLWRPWLVVSITLAGTALAVLVAWLMPPVYQSTSRILVESQQIPDALARSTVTASAAERLALIEQRLMTRANLLDVSRRLGLFADRPGLSPTDRVEILRDATRIESISFNSNPRYRGPTQVSAFTITFTSSDALQAARVTNEFADMVLAQNLAARTARASETHDFFRAEVERLGAELDALEREIAEHKSLNKDYLPGTMSLRLAEVSGLRQQMVSRAARISRLELGGEAALTENARIALDAVKPEQVAFNPLTNGQLDLLRTKQQFTLDRIAVLQTAIDRSTQVEMTLNAMQRKADLLQVRHKEALRKASEAETGQKLEDSRQAERFEVIEPARMPDAPIAPRRPFIAIGGGLASLSLAVGLAGLFEWMSRLLRSSTDFQRLLNVRPVMVMPYLQTRRERRRVWRQRIAIALGGAVMIGIGIWASPINLPAETLSVAQLSQPLQFVDAWMQARGVE